MSQAEESSNVQSEGAENLSLETTGVPFSSSWYQSMQRILGRATCELLGLFAIPDDFILSVVIPVYNEEKTLEALVRTVAEVPIHKHRLFWSTTAAGTVRGRS